MAQELISRRLRMMLMDYLAGASVLREIENEFEAADIPYAPTIPKPDEPEPIGVV